MLYVNARQPEACPVAMSRETWGVLAPTLRLSHYSFDEGRANSLTRNATHSPTDNDRTPPMLQHNPHPLETNISPSSNFLNPCAMSKMSKMH